RPPTGFGRGADDDLGEDETVEWTKSVKTTRDFYDVEDDNVNIDELSYQNQHPGQQHVNYQGQYQQQRSRKNDWDFDPHSMVLGYSGNYECTGIDAPCLSVEALV
ncbi:hypothetical protein CPC16_004971, partial [Podila verticillata]